LVARDILPAKVGFDQEHLDQAVGWLIRAVAPARGGLSPGYRVGSGWLAPTTDDAAVAIPTLLRYHEVRPQRAADEVAERLGESLLAVQRADGSFAGHLRGSVPATGDALLALLALLDRQADDAQLAGATLRAARWLVETQRPDGAWPQTTGMEGRAAWALRRASIALDDGVLGDAGSAHVRWLAERQRSDGWMEGQEQRTTAEIGSVLEGLVEIGIDGDELALSVAADLLAGVERAYRRPGSGVRLRWRNHMAGRIRSSWRGAGQSASMEGSARIALGAARMARLGGADASRIRRFGDELMDAVRSSQILHGGADGLSGGVPATAPLWTAPSTELVVRATKPFADALMERRGDGGPQERLG